jgi:tetratricopeptide (TPR) repeat protein
MLRPRVFRAATLVQLLALLCAASLFGQDKPDAQRLYADGKYDDSRRVCLAAIAADPSDLDSYVLLSWSLVGMGRYADAENYALKGYALRRDPRLTEVLGETAYFLGRNDAALSNFQNYVAALPEGARVGAAYYYMGEIYLRLSRFSHADIAFSTALQFSPGSSKWWTRLGYARERRNDLSNALEAYKKALALDPRLEDALSGAARVTEALR